MGYPVWDPSVSRGQIPPGTHREYQGPVRYDIRDPSGNRLRVLAGKAGPFRSRERNCQGANGPESELARSNCPIRSWERLGLGTKRLGTGLIMTEQSVNAITH